MSDPFFDYIKNNRDTTSNHLYGHFDVEKKWTNATYIDLPNVSFNSMTLADALLKRKSTRDYSTMPLELNDVAYVLQMSLGKNSDSQGCRQYPFPSGGNFYPMETYLLIQNVARLEKGVYHYSSVDHSVAKIGDASAAFEQTYTELSNMILSHTTRSSTEPSMFILMTMVKSRCIQKYGSLSYPLALIEGGHRGQNVCLAAASKDLGCCPIGSTLYDEIHTLIGVDGVNEHYVYGIALGNKM